MQRSIESTPPGVTDDAHVTSTPDIRSNVLQYPGIARRRALPLDSDLTTQKSTSTESGALVDYGTSALRGGQAQAFVTPAADRRWLFANVEFDERTLDLKVAGEIVEIEPKPLDVLRYLLQHAGEVVTKDELATAVWPRRILSDSVLAKTVSRLREVLGDTDQAIIKTVHGYGYRLVAAVQIKETAAPTHSRLNLSIGDTPPLRPMWRLEQRLGSGGHGEAWKARHEKTRECRVFKFALDESSLTALKREITLFRVVNDTLGDEAKVLDLLDWNLEQPPCFIEMPFVAGGSLVDWTETHGGLSRIPLEDRLEVIASIADAIAAVHLVGVLHKDLKPSNVLAIPKDNHQIDIRLADFGSGGMLDAKRMESLGITRLGFTQTIAMNASQAGTPLYLAPEVIAGQPFTVKADIYALGIMLYQFVVGDFRKGLSPGWERAIEDELLREDISYAAEGAADSRLGDTGDLARRLRSLNERRQQRALEYAAKEKAALTQRALDRAKARRTGLIAAFIALVVGFATSSYLYVQTCRERDRAEIESRRAQGVIDFISRDMLATLTSGKTPIKSVTVRQLLDSAALEVDKQFSTEPGTAAAVHAALAHSYLNLQTYDAAKAELDRSLKLYSMPLS